MKDIKTTVKRSRKKLPKVILTKSEVITMIDVADHPRDKAMV